MSGICEGRVVIVTGAANGIGKAHALAFAREGAKVVVNDIGASREGEGRSESAAQAVVDEIKALGGEAYADGADVTDFAACGRMVERAIKTFGDLHVVVNNAGFLRDRMFFSTSEDEWDSVIGVHLKGHFCTSRHAAAYWRAQSKAGKAVDARIINTSSGAGLQGSVAQATYSAAKGAIAALTLVQAAELGRYGVTANSIAPIARTRMTEEVFAATMAKPGEGEFDFMAPENVSPLLVWLGSPAAAHVTGQCFEAAGNYVMVNEGWHDGPKAENPAGNAAFAPADVGAAVEDVLARMTPAKKVYGT